MKMNEMFSVQLCLMVVSPHEAYLVTKGLKFDEENKFDETISGYYKLRKEYRDYFKEEFRIGA